MKIQEFINDFKTMIQTKDATVFNEKYMEPARKSLMHAAEVTNEAVKKYTPVVVDSSKKLWGKSVETAKEMSKKAEQKMDEMKNQKQPGETNTTTTTTTTTKPENNVKKDIENP